MNNPALSYVLTTRNKLPLLREVLTRLIQARQPDEEIIVVDGASSDGTVEYLREHLGLGNIRHFISGPDVGEAHGFNKGLLIAGGELIKVITDDDAFYWPGIQECKEFMLSHPDIDVLGTGGAGTRWKSMDPFVPQCEAYEQAYRLWEDRSEPFSFSGLGLMMRRSSLPLLGLFHTGIVWIDQEFTLRVTSGMANLAWYTGSTWVRIINPQSNTTTQKERMTNEGKRLNQFYLGAAPTNTRRSVSARFPGQAYLRPIKRLLSKDKAIAIPTAHYQAVLSGDWEYVFKLSYSWLQRQNELQQGKFLFKEQKTDGAASMPQKMSA